MLIIKRAAALSAVLAGSLMLQGCLVGAAVGAGAAVVGAGASVVGAGVDAVTKASRTTTCGRPAVASIGSWLAASSGSRSAVGMPVAQAASRQGNASRVRRGVTGGSPWEAGESRRCKTVA